jgi:hypothetical protein
MNDAGPEYGQRSVLQHILNKNALDTVGVILNDQGEIFTFEREPTYRELVDRITVQGPTARGRQAGRLLVRRGGSCKLRLPAGWQPVPPNRAGDAGRASTSPIRADEQSHLCQAVRPAAAGAAVSGTLSPVRRRRWACCACRGQPVA